MQSCNMSVAHTQNVDDFFAHLFLLMRAHKAKKKKKKDIKKKIRNSAKLRKTTLGFYRATIRGKEKQIIRIK